jgi:hypothetical protein
MSDNDCGWNSCMQWMEDTGDYRLGTIEMMNSPCVVIAYVESHDPMKLFSPYGAEEWNNKKWRQLYIVDRTIILGNRQYPYDNLDLQGAAITWLRDIMNSLPGYGPYPNETINLNIQRTNVIKDKRIKFNFYTNYMYNDVYDYKLAFIADQHLEDGDTYDINFSGPAVCNRCGKELELNEIEAHQLCCFDCGGRWRCECCGEWFYDSDEYYEVNEVNRVCKRCYYDLDWCECCGYHRFSEYFKTIFIQFVNSENEKIIKEFNYNYFVSICESCILDKKYVKLYGPLFIVKDEYGVSRRVFDVRNITDAGLEYGGFSESAIEILKLMRDTKSDEERISLLEKIGY